ncbi:DUF937 domain-containing protein [Luteimonas sp. MC1825]|uniref:DUF937 domain-containing protein n=1 Tax=Luteimonas sp. MC1825 TaxID=2761107 RepID=UPI00161E2E1E|nr:DUF937 domain-containing protein [Luteimonas sp. MC1825]MBB6598902.1 DUF937 domain-containing protein [Luteimonas sp. MC1825]QOC89048.1 DUF937 domain-containing protein [Luteimonas sp. MC1825]
MAMLTDDLLAQLQGAPAQQLAQQLGLTPSQASGAINAALPLLLGALGRNASQPQGAQALYGALQKDHAGMDIGSVLGAVLGSGGAGQGGAILGHIFGGGQQRAEAGVAQATGLGQGTAGQLLKMLAPIVMAYLAKRAMSSGQAQQNDGAAALGDMLGQEQQQIRQEGGLGGGLLGAVLDQDGDGQLGLGDLARLGGLFGRK